MAKLLVFGNWDKLPQANTFFFKMSIRSNYNNPSSGDVRTSLALEVNAPPISTLNRSLIPCITSGGLFKASQHVAKFPSCLWSLLLRTFPQCWKEQNFHTGQISYKQIPHCFSTISLIDLSLSCNSKLWLFK